MNVFDSHLHIIDPSFPLIQNNGYLPSGFLVEDYLRTAEKLRISSGVVVSGSFQMFDQQYLISALSQLNVERQDFVGVTQLPASASDDEILYLAKMGVRGLRFNLKRGGSESVSKLKDFSQRVFELAGWHVELYIGFDALDNLQNMLPSLPAVSIDHLGLESRSLPILKKLMERNVKVKATGFGRLDFDFLPEIQELHQINPSGLMFGTDLPSTRAPKPFDAGHVDLLKQHMSLSDFKKIMWDNGRLFYRF